MAEDTKHWVDFEQDGYRVHAMGVFKRFRGTAMCWDDLEELDTEVEEIIKASRSRKVVKLAAGHFGAPVEVYVKRYNHRSLLRMVLRTGRRTRGREEFDLGWKLIEKGIRTPRPVWLAEKKGAVSQYSLLATEALPHAESAVGRWLRCESEKQRKELLVALGQFTGRMHDAGFYHDDFKAQHLLIFPDRPSSAKEFFVIDLLGGSFPAVLSPLRRAKNLYQILRSFHPKRKNFHFTAEHRDTFLLAYAGSAPEVSEWSRWVQRVGSLKGRRI
jgi:tRNA A-37 threonylcarbamoyl transferase component Bud32